MTITIPLFIFGVNIKYKCTHVLHFMLDVLKWTPFFLQTEKGLFCLGGRSKIDSVLPEKGKVYLASNRLFSGGGGRGVKRTPHAKDR